MYIPTSRALIWRGIRIACIPALATFLLPAQSITVSNPTPNATISGTAAFSASVTGLPGAAAVEFWLGGRRLGTSSAPPYSVSWNTAYGNDGASVLTVIARDAFGSALASAEQPFVIRNQGNSLVVNSPDLSQPLRGTVTLSMSGSDSALFPAFWPVYVDGDQLAIAYSDNSGLRANTVSAQLDTTQIPNGRHELHIGLHSNYWTTDPGQKSYTNWRGMVQRFITVNNGRSLMEVVPSHLHVYLAPGQALAAGCWQLFTDNTRSACETASYISSDPAVAAVHASTGTITAVGTGFATITVTSGGKTGRSYVWVRSAAGIPHFAANGQMLNGHQSGSSVFFVAPFHLEPRLLSADTALAAEVKRAGINTLTRGFYMNPRDISTSFSNWQTSFNGSAGADFQWAKNNGFYLYGIGDDCCRGIGGDAWYTLNWPSGQQAIQYGMSQLAATGVALAVDVVDEATMIWGPTPKPARFVGQTGTFTSVACSGTTCTVNWPNNPVGGGRQFALQGSTNAALNTPAGMLYTAANAGGTGFTFTPASAVIGTFTAASDPSLEFLWWSGPYCSGGAPCNPQVPNTAIQTFTNWMRTAAAAVPISWPAMGISPVDQQAAWMGPGSVSDFASHYWDTQNIRKTYPWGTSIPEEIAWMRYRFYERQPFMMLDRPQVMLKSMASFAYRKQTAGSFYTPPGDVLDVPGPEPEAVGSGVLAAAALGVAGVRVYNFEEAAAALGRASAPMGATLSTGIHPFAADPLVIRSWRSLAYASSLLTKVLQPYLVATALNSPAHGKNIVTAARQGGDGRMLLVVNGNDWERTLPLDFTPYRTGNTATRYRVSANRLQTSTLPDSSGETITLGAGEAVAYLFPLAARNYATPVQVAAPSGYKVALQYNYLYAGFVQEVATGVDCTGGCTLPIDWRLGEVFYRYFYMDSAGAIVSAGTVQQLPAGATSLVLPGGPAGVSVTVSPTTAVLNAGQTAQLNASVTGTTNAAVTWWVDPAVGTVSTTGLYTAPPSVSASQVVTVKATSAADPSKSGSASVTLNVSPAVAVSVTPGSASLQPSQTAQFTASVTGTTNTAVTWSVSPAVGTVSTNGLYTAPALVSATQVVTVKATSAADPSRSDSASVTLNAPAAIALAVSPGSVSLEPSQTTQFTATVTGTTNTAVTWSVSPAVGTVSGTGLYTAPLQVSATQVVTVKATSAADPSKSASASVTLNVSPAVAVSVTPGSASLQPSQTAQFTASVTGTANTGVTWSVSPAVGTVSTNGLYRAPASIAAAQTVKLIAVSAEDPAKSSSATVTLNPAAPTVAVTPPSATVKTGQTVQLRAELSGTSEPVVWSISPALGTITSAGLYTAPAAITGNNVSVVVTATAGIASGRAALTIRRK